MHPEVISDKPGKCPKCGMELVEKEDHKHAIESPKEEKSVLKEILKTENFWRKTVRYDLYVKDTIVNFTGKTGEQLRSTVNFRLLHYILQKEILLKFIFTICLRKIQDCTGTE
jgi:hypothetical protein